MSGARRPPIERGGAYLLALTALLVLTGVGIALSGIALLERRLGTADQEQLQALNAADSGLALAAARLLAGAGSDELELVFGTTRAAGVVRSSRVRVRAPVLVAASPCASCDPAVGRVSYALAALGERVLWPGRSSRFVPRAVARVAVEATLTLQPWPIPGSPSPARGGPAIGPPCAPETRARLRAQLVGELNPTACSFGPGPLAVRVRDAESGSTCVVRIPVCALLTGWRER